MGGKSVKDIVVKVIPSSIANPFVIAHHYSGKVVQNSNLHFGAFLDGVLHGVMSYGPSIDKKRMLGTVRGTGWNEYLELNRMAFDDHLPRNSESRCLGISLRLIRKNAPQIKWVVSFADGCQCGDGTIYRASNFVLVDIKRNTSLLRFQGQVIARKTLDNPNYVRRGLSSTNARQLGATPLVGFQLKYIYFLDPTYRARLTVSVIPFSRIDELGAGLYKGQKITRAERHGDGAQGSELNRRDPQECGHPNIE